MKFSQRIGVAPPNKPVQHGAMDMELRSSLWNVAKIYVWDKYSARGTYRTTKYSNLGGLVELLWLLHFKAPMDTIPDMWDDCLSKIREYFFKAEWYQVYDFMEFVAEKMPGDKEAFLGLSNHFLAAESAPYRFVNGILAPITSEEEIAEIERAATNSGPFTTARRHIQTAVNLLSDRKHPDFRNSIKESISAVEACARQITGNNKATLGQALADLEAKKALHPALKKGLSAIYGYTSDEGGIRHALLEEDTLTRDDAQFMLVACSSFVNYLIALSAD